MLLRKTLCAYEIPVLWNFTAEAAYKKQSCQVPLDMDFLLLIGLTGVK